MSHIPTAPDLKTELADVVRQHRKTLANWPKATHSGLDRLEVGRYSTVGGALVTVEVVLEYRTGYIYNPPNSKDERRIHLSAEAKCHGNGCIGQNFQKEHSSYVLLDDDADKTAEAVLPYAQAAREWAQVHAEKCRAQPYTR